MDPSKAKTLRAIPQTRIVAAGSQVSCELAEEVVILHLDAGIYYGLDAIGARIWELIQTPTTVEAVRDILLDEYEVEPERCERDLIAFLERLAGEDLVKFS